jgi:hypothetical protein
MTICPIAIAVGCQKCPLFKICPVKSVLGDAPKTPAAKPLVSNAKKSSAKAPAAAAKKKPAKPAAARKKSS